MRCLAAILVAAPVLIGLAPAPQDARSIVAERVMKLTRDSSWTRVAAVPIRFRTYHPQGLVKIGDMFCVSSVDRERHAGHLFKMDASGNLVADLKLGDDVLYHPSGIDYDGQQISVAVAEYRPDSRSTVYRVDPDRMTATDVFRFADHIGAVVHDTDDNTLHGVSWGSRRFYRWMIPRWDDVVRTLNVSHYVDYQDCKYAGSHRMLCTGVTELRQAQGAAPFRLGAIELVDLAFGLPVHQVPLQLWTTTGLSMTQNPVWIEASASGLRGYFIPEDDVSTMYVYEVETK